MATFIHTSDWHIGYYYGNVDEALREKLSRARLNAVNAIFLYARAKGVPLILCTGDVIHDGQLAPEEHLEKLFDVIRRYPEIRVIMMAGESDARITHNVYDRIEPSRYPSNVHTVIGNEIIPVEEMNLTIYASAGSSDVDSEPLHWIEEKEIDHRRINVAMLYGGDTQPGLVSEKGLDYLALGGRHSAGIADKRAYFPGTPEPMGFDDNGYPLRVTIPNPGDIPEVKKAPGVRQYNWNRVEVDFSDCTFSSMTHTLETLESNEVREAILTGTLSAKYYEQYRQLLTRNRPRYYRIHDGVSLGWGSDEWSVIGHGFEAAVARRLLELKEQEEPLPEEILNNVVPMGQQAVVEEDATITKNEIIDTALLKLYQQHKEIT